MSNSETAWQASIDYKAYGLSGDSKTRMAMAKVARSAIRAAGYRTEVLCRKQEDAAKMAEEIMKASGVPMRVDEVVLISL